MEWGLWVGVYLGLGCLAWHLWQLTLQLRILIISGARAAEIHLRRRSPDPLPSQPGETAAGHPPPAPPPPPPDPRLHVQFLDLYNEPCGEDWIDPRQRRHSVSLQGRCFMASHCDEAGTWIYREVTG